MSTVVGRLVTLHDQCVRIVLSSSFDLCLHEQRLQCSWAPMLTATRPVDQCQQRKCFTTLHADGHVESVSTPPQIKHALPIWSWALWRF